MKSTQIRDGAAAESVATLRLRVEILDALMAQKGITTVAATAREAKVSRATLFRLRGHKLNASLPVAMRLAACAGTTVDALFERAVAVR